MAPGVARKAKQGGDGKNIAYYVACMTHAQRYDLWYGKETVMVSVKFLASYDEALNSIKRPGMQDLGDKGRRSVEGDLRNVVAKDNPTKRDAEKGKRWKPPQAGWVKSNTGVGFCPNSGKASTGIVVRGPSGEVLLTG
jgi:hypothetical protein